MMTSGRRVSVIIPTFNRAGYVVAAVESVLRQTLHDVEVIVVDDGSTDDTRERLAPFDGKLRYVRTANQGPARARNEGMARASGEYIAWLDSDDLYYPFKLQVQADVLDRFPDIGLVCSDASAFDDEGYFDEWHLKRYHASGYRPGGLTYDTLYSSKVLLSQVLTHAALPPAFRAEWMTRRLYWGRIFDAYLKNTLVFTPTVMFRRTVLERVGPQQPRFGLFHDLEFVLRVTRNYPVAFLDVPTYKLRYHPGQVSTMVGPERELIAIRKQRDMLRVFKAHCGSHGGAHQGHSSSVDAHMARLHRAIALPMLALDPGNPHRDKCYPRRARQHLRRCAALGQPEWFLWALSFTPHQLRRVGVATIGLRRRVVEKLKGWMRRDAER